MDMDTTIKCIALKEEKIKEIVEEVININVNDGINFEIKDISYIREENEYENFRISLIANVGKTKNSMKLDLTTGDAIIPREIEYTFDTLKIKNLWNVLQILNSRDFNVFKNVVFFILSLSFLIFFSYFFLK